MTDESERAAIEAQLARYSWNGEIEYDTFVCGQCSVEHPRAAGDILRDGEPHAYMRSTPAGGDSVGYDVYLYVAPVTGDEPAFDATFRVLYASHDERGHGHSMQGGARFENGERVASLTREEALAHPRLQDVWDVLDWLAFADPMAHQVVFHGHEVTAANWPAIALGDAHLGRGKRKLNVFQRWMHRSR